MRKKRLILAALSSLVLLYSLSCLVTGAMDDHRTRAQIKALVQRREAVRTLPGEPDPLAGYRALHAQNPDLVGWLTIEGTQLDYPVMQRPGDAEFYLSHDFDGAYNKNGLPFLDARCNLEEDAILLLHGHNTGAGLIFGGLTRYREEDYHRAHPTILFDTLDEQAEYEIIAVILSRVHREDETGFRYYRLEGTETEAGFNAYVENIRALALYDTGLTAQYGDRLLVLSTCEYSVKNGRIAVIARKR